MGDSTAMTIEFLRARLLSERSVSRTARQRAEQLAKRVLELEEQLRSVTIQRKKAEKAAVEVLAILESQGIGDLSETIDSISDLDETPSEKGFDGTLKEDGSSTASRIERSEVDDGLSGSEPEVSHSHGRSLSWKSESNTLYSEDKQKIKQIRQRRRSFMPVSRTSSKHHFGKSCRKIKRKDMGSTADGTIRKHIPLDVLGSGEFTCSNYSDDQPEVSVEASSGMMEKATIDTMVSQYVNDNNKNTEPQPNAKDCGRDEEMEKALEQQAKLIGQFQAEENAQREWEEKYSETMIPTLAYYEPGNQSSIPEHSSSQSKEETIELTDSIPDYDKDEKRREKLVSNTEQPVTLSFSSSEKNSRSNDSSNEVLQNGSTSGDLNATHIGKYSNGSNNSTVCETKTASQDTSISTSEHSGFIRKEKQNGIVLHADIKNGYQSPPSLTADGQKILKNDHNKLKEVQTLQKNDTELQRELPQAPSSSVGGVLEALQRAKLSLSQELCKLPSKNQETLALAAGLSSQTRITTLDGGLDIPIGSASLFRLPTDLFPSPNLSGPRYYSSGLDLSTSRSDVGYAVSQNSFRDLSTTSYGGTGPRVFPHKDYFDNQLNPSLPDYVRNSRAHSVLSVERPPSFNEFSRSRSGVRNAAFPGAWYSSYGVGDQAARRDMRML